MNLPGVKEIRGKGLLNAIVVDDRSEDQSRAWDICMKFADLGKYYSSMFCQYLTNYTIGLLAKPTHGHIIRLAPPLVINDQELDEALEILERGIRTA